MPYTYNFPTIEKYVPHNQETFLAQITKVTEEVGEVASEALKPYSEGDDFIIEVLDVIHCCEILLRSFSQMTVDLAREHVIAKNAQRGYYGADGDAA